MKKAPTLILSTVLILLLAFLLLNLTGSNPASPTMALALVPEYPSTVPLIELTGTGFTPSDSTITAGMSVTFRNSTSTHHMLIGGTGFLQNTNTVFLPLVHNDAGTFTAQFTSLTEADAQSLEPPTAVDTHASLASTCQFQVPLPPGAEYTHRYTTTGECHVSLATAAHTTNIAIDAAEGAASLTGRVLDTTNAVQGSEQPIVGAAVSLLDTEYTAVSDDQGYFTISGIEPAGEHVLDINTAEAQAAPDGSAYAGFREKIEIVAGISNVVDRPFYLPRIDMDSLTTVDPAAQTTVNNPNLDVTMTVPANTARAEDGSLFAGNLSISEVPLSLAPAALPQELDPGLLITIQPVGVTFDTPAPITFPNYDNLAPGNELDLWSLDPENGEFIVVGTGQVSADGTVIEMIAGGIRAADWHLVLPPVAGSDTGLNANNIGRGDAGCLSSTITFHSGCLGTNITLPAYTSLGDQRPLSLVYKSERAYPYITVPFESTVPVRAAVPAMLSYRLNIEGIDVGPETFLDTSPFNENVDETLHATAATEADYFTTGVYRYSLTTTSHYPNSTVASRFNGRTPVVNSQSSPFGAGWEVAEISTLHQNADGSILITNGDGSAQNFNPAPLDFTDWSVEGVPDAGNWIVSEDGQSVEQSTVDGSLSFFVSPEEFINTTIRGTIRVDTSSDDDFIGFVFGYQSPISVNGDAEDDYEFLIFDWRQITQTSVTGYTAQEGFALSRAQGIIPNDINTYMTFWAHEDTPEFDVLATDFGDDKGWLDFTDYYFELTFETNRIQIAIDGEEIFDVSGAFTPGRFGFYTYSQRNVQFSNVTSSAETERFVGPEGDYSTLTRDDTGNFVRRMKDGTEYHFNADGWQTAVIDSNGNTTSYEYDNHGRLTTITDPVGLVTTLAYSGDHLQSVTDPSGRTTTFSHDAVGNLTSVTFPDGSGRSFGYDNRHLMTSETDERGQTTTRVYNDYGQIISTTLADGTLREATASLSVGLVAEGQGTMSNPAPVTRPEDEVSTMIDGEGRVTIYETGRFGETTQLTDPAGFSTTINRDADGNPTQTTFPSGAVFTRTFDDLGNMLSLTDETVGGTTLFTYEPIFNQVTTVTNPFNHTTHLVYDGQGNLTQITTPLNRSMAFDYSGRGLITSMVDTLGTTSTYRYDSEGHLTTLTQGDGAAQRTATMAYTSEGYLDTLTDPLGRLFDFAYDNMGRLISEILPGGRTISYAYDEAGNLTSLTPPGKPAHTFGYNEIDLLKTYNAPSVTNGGSNQTTYSYNNAQELVKVVRPDGLTIDYGYDTAGRLAQVTIPRGNYTYGYSSTTGQLTTLTDPDSGSLTYSYSGDLISQANWTGQISGTVGYGYDAAARLSAIDIDGVSYNFGYDADSLLTQAGNLTLDYDAATGLITSSTLGNVTDSWGFNQFAELDSYSAAYNSSDLFDVQYTRDKLGRVTQKVETVNGVTTTYGYTYDTAGRLHQVRVNGTLQATYTYDLNGNRLSDGTNSGTYDDQDRLLSYGTATYVYTANGELASKTEGAQTTSYDYDVLGNLLGVTLPDGTQIEYVIDAANRRVGRKVNGVLGKGWLYGDDLNPVAELDGSGNMVSHFIYGSKSNVPDYMVQDGTAYRIVSDHLGSVRLVVNVTTGAVAQRMNYDAWGMVTEDTNPGFQPFGFAGGIYDADTGLVRFGARDYDAEVGRWTAKDPILFDGGDANLYGYVDNSPVNYIDPSGRWFQIAFGVIRWGATTVGGVGVRTGISRTAASLPAAASLLPLPPPNHPCLEDPLGCYEESGEEPDLPDQECDNDEQPDTGGTPKFDQPWHHPEYWNGDSYDPFEKNRNAPPYAPPNNLEYWWQDWPFPIAFA